MRERPILFSAPMVRALLAGRKTQTRRTVKRCGLWESTAGSGLRPMPEACPYGQPGDRLWVKETWRPRAADSPWDLVVRYAADGQDRWIYDEEFGDKDWNMPKAAARGNVSPLFMPRWASRITLEVTGVRVERLQDISDVHAIAEGVDPSPGMRGDDDLVIHRILQSFPTLRLAPVARFVLLWDTINGARAGANWNANPWVWVVEFKRITP